MSERLACSDAERALAERVEAALPEPQRSALDAHLAGCAACRELAEAVAFVVETLHARPQVSPTPDLAERAASRALARARRPRFVAGSAWGSPAPLPIAAALALALTGSVLLLASPAGASAVAASRLAERSVNAREYLLERGDRLVEDLRLLRLVVSTAFEARLERVNDRVEDYRRLLERRRERQPSDEASLRRWHSAHGGRGLANPARIACVDVDGAHASRAVVPHRTSAANPEGA